MLCLKRLKSGFGPQRPSQFQSSTEVFASLFPEFKVHEQRHGPLYKEEECRESHEDYMKVVKVMNVTKDVKVVNAMNAKKVIKVMN